VSTLAIDRGTGALTLIATTPGVVGNGASAFQLAGGRTLVTSLDSAFVVVSDASANAISSWAVGPSGALTRASTVTLPGGAFASALAFDGPGTTLYAAGSAFGPGGGTASLINSVHVLSYAPATGALALVGQPLPLAGTLPSDIAIDPSGAHVYVPDIVFGPATASGAQVVTGQVEVFAIGAGTLAPGPVYVDKAGFGPTGLRFNATGTFAYAEDLVATGWSVVAFSVDLATGALAPSGAAAPSGGQGGTPTAFTIDASGSFAFTGDVGSNRVAAFAIDATTGTARTNGAPVAYGTGGGGTIAVVAVR